MPQHYGNKKKTKPVPRHRKRTSDPNLEPGLAAATRRSQRTRKAASAKKPPIPKTRSWGSLVADIRNKLEERPVPSQLVPNIGTPVKKRRRR